MIIDPSETSGRELYRVLISTVCPRPIAFVSTRSASGVTNLAPFSYFNVVGSNPPLVTIAIGKRTWDGKQVPKDTLANIEETRELVINIATESMVEAVNDSSAEYAPDESEIDALGLTTVESDLVAPPRIAQCPVQFECKLDRVVQLGNAQQYGLVVAEVVRFHIDDDIWVAEESAVDPTRLRPLSRLGGTKYATVGEIIDTPRPGKPKR